MLPPSPQPCCQPWCAGEGSAVAKIEGRITQISFPEHESRDEGVLNTNPVGSLELSCPRMKLEMPYLISLGCAAEVGHPQTRRDGKLMFAAALKPGAGSS